jgi:hypothetical protein
MESNNVKAFLNFAIEQHQTPNAKRQTKITQ